MVKRDVLKMKQRFGYVYRLQKEQLESEQNRWNNVLEKKQKLEGLGLHGTLNKPGHYEADCIVLSHFQLGAGGRMVITDFFELEWKENQRDYYFQVVC